MNFHCAVGKDSQVRECLAYCLLCVFPAAGGGVHENELWELHATNNATLFIFLLTPSQPVAVALAAGATARGPWTNLSIYHIHRAF